MKDGTLNPSSPGKAPAYWDRNSECWRGNKGWPKGIMDDWFVTLGDRHGVNAGIVLASREQKHNILAFDPDLACDTEEETERSVLLLAQIYEFLVKRYGPIWCRETRRGRGMVLLRFPYGVDAGKKETTHLTDPQGVALGKIEILGDGEQAVLAGIHAFTKAPITWTRTDRPQDVRLAPEIDDGMPMLESRADFNKMLEELEGELALSGIRCSRSAASKRKIPRADGANATKASPADRAAPSTAMLIKALQILPNPRNASREGIYLRVMHGVSGCIRAGKALGMIDKVEEDKIIESAAAWAAKWPSATAMSASNEEAKFRSDFLLRDELFGGWPSLKSVAAELDFDGIALLEAEHDFIFEKAPPDFGSEDPGAAEQSLYPRGRKPSVEILTLTDVRNLPPQKWLVDDIVPEASFVSPYGSPKSGKTFLMLSMLLHVTVGWDWMGKKTMQGAVIYIVGEGARSLKGRIEAMQQYYGIGDEAPFYVISRMVNFMEAGSVRMLAEDLEDFMKSKGQTLAAVAVDTVARAIPGADENSAKEMGVFISGCDRLRERLNCTVVGIHHSGKDKSKGARGSNTLLAAVDAEYHVERKDAFTTLTVSDMRDGASGEVIMFDMLQVPTSNGKTTLVPVLRKEAPVSTGVAPEKVKEPTGDLGVAWISLKEALRVNGRDRAGTIVCTTDAWRELYYSKKIDVTSTAKQKGFTRAGDKLITSGRIDINGDYVWLKTIGCTADFPMKPDEMDSLLDTPPASGAIN